MSPCLVCTGLRHFCIAGFLERTMVLCNHGQLDSYLDEFVFRFNRRASASRELLFYRLLQQAVVTDPVTYDMVVM
jgi:hypothetical protein